MADHEARVLRVLRRIEEDPTGDLSLDALAEVAAMSRFHWHRVFVAVTGRSVAETVRIVRMHRAACALAETDRPVARIAAEVGHPNLASFTRMFRAAYGTTPAAFRARGARPAPPCHGGDRPMPDVRIREEPPRRLAATLHRGAFHDIGHAFRRAAAVLASRGLADEIRGAVGVFHDDPCAVPEGELRSHAGFVLADGATVPEGLEEVAVAGGRHAVLLHRGPYATLRAAYDALYGGWLPASGEEPRDAPPIEVYLNDPDETPPDELLTEICLPLREEAGVTPPR